MHTYYVLMRDNAWWIQRDPPDTEIVLYGPYHTRAEAEADARGLTRTAKYGHLPGFVTSEPALRSPHWAGKLGDIQSHSRRQTA